MQTVKVNFALQGGGAHGAFTWGVIDRLLEEEWLEFEGVSGSSAGAMNALMLAEGWRLGGRSGAQSKLNEFWGAVSAMERGPALSEYLEGSMARLWLHTMKYVSPYDINLLDINPLRSLLNQLVDFEALSSDSPFRLFMAATEVRSGKLKIFRETELTVEHLLASACLPAMHKAIDIEGVNYWDGGFSANPAIFPLLYDCDSDDVIIVLLQSLVGSDLPITAEAITERVTEMSFQSSFMREMSEIANIKRLSKRKWFPLGVAERKITKLRTHLIQSDELLAGLGRSSKYDTRKVFLDSLKAAGRDSAAIWLELYQDKLGKKASCDIDALFA
ncbi:patatin-like phospholipase family protein [Neptunomonas antarctica]|uniref:NTE family protein n=1 Tax=Neptunomonas antarctica TaxID=619304 RepID=A0A1N7MEX7_9GAMM|nr:patatin-like phospholipase family protein [Neptunomonas antarctica]SIS84695.1 NTE family protein [Neptunomonas antarctica]